MPVTFENDDDIIVYALERVISHARRTQHIFVAQCVWWLASVLRLEQELAFHIDRIQGHRDIDLQEQRSREVTPADKDLVVNQYADQVLDIAEEYLKESRRLREIVASKASGKTKAGQRNPSKVSKKYLKKSERRPRVDTIRPQRDLSKTEGIDVSEISRRKIAGECLRCAWPSDRKGNHRVKDCRRPIKLGKGTAQFPNKKELRYQQELEEASYEESSSDLSSED